MCDAGTAVTNTTTTMVEATKPVRARSAYNFFFRESRYDVQAAILRETGKRGSYLEMSRAVARAWRQVPQSERVYYENLAKQDKFRYALELVNWKMQKSDANTAVPQDNNKQLIPITPSDSDDKIIKPVMQNHEDRPSTMTSMVGLCLLEASTRGNYYQVSHDSTNSVFPQGETYTFDEQDMEPFAITFPPPPPTPCQVEFDFPQVRPLEHMLESPHALMHTWTQQDMALLKKALGILY